MGGLLPEATSTNKGLMPAIYDRYNKVLITLNSPKERIYKILSIKDGVYFYAVLVGSRGDSTGTYHFTGYSGGNGFKFNIDHTGDVSNWVTEVYYGNIDNRNCDIYVKITTSQELCIQLRATNSSDIFPTLDTCDNLPSDAIKIDIK